MVVPACPCLSLYVHVRHCLSLSVPVCPCLSLYVSTFAIPSCLPLQMNITVFITMNINTLTILSKGTVPTPANFVFNFFCTFHLVSSITLSFNPNSYILVINITGGFIWFLSSFFLFFLFFFIVNQFNIRLSFSIFFMNINGWWFQLFTNRFLKKILDAEWITLWALNFWPSIYKKVWWFLVNLKFTKSAANKRRPLITALILRC